jgi:hypothetical protein
MVWDVKQVGDDRRLRDTWVQVAYDRHGDDPHWIPPLRSDMRRGADRRKNPFLRHADVEHFVLFRDGQPVGRVAATIHHDYVESTGSACGFFGFLSCVEDLEAMRALLGTAERWLAQRGMKQIAGPYNYFLGQEMGLLVSGFDAPPALFQTYNPPSYPELLRACGYELRYRADTYTVAGDELRRLHQHVGHVTQRWRAELRLSSRPLDPRRFREDIELVRQLFNQSFVGHYGLTAYPKDVFDFLILPMRRLLDPQLIRFIERDGEPVAFAAVVPDLNQILRRLNGRIRPVDVLRLPRLRRTVDEAVVLLVGVRPNLPIGVGPVLFAEMLAAATAGGYRALHTTWVHQDNSALRLLLKRLCGELPPRKTYEIVGRELQAA